MEHLAPIEDAVALLQEMPTSLVSVLSIHPAAVIHLVPSAVIAKLDTFVSLVAVVEVFAFQQGMSILAPTQISRYVACLQKD